MSAFEKGELADTEKYLPGTYRRGHKLPPIRQKIVKSAYFNKN